MAGYVEEFVAFLGWKVDDKELDKFKNQVEDLGSMLKGVATVVAGAAAGLTTLTAVVNQTTAANVALAKSVGLSSSFLEAMGAVVSPLGFEMENIVDLAEEMNNKLGESSGLGKPLSAVSDSLKILGLEYKNIQGLSREDQFFAILEAAKGLEDAQQAVSAVDMLMGGEANKILGYLRTQDESLLQLVRRQMQLNMLTEEGRSGAERFNKTFNDMKNVINSAKSQFFGLMGEALSPLLESYSDWIAANSDIIKAQIAKWAEQIGRALSWLIQVMTWFVSKVNDVVDMLGGMQNVLKLTGVVLAGVFGAKTIAAIGSFIKFMRLAGTEALLMNIKAALIPATIALIIALFILLGEDLYQFFTGGESALGKIGSKISEFVYDNIRPTIANFLGMTPEELDQQFLSVIDSISWFWGKVIDWAAWGIDGTVKYTKFFFQLIGFLWDRIAEFAHGMAPLAQEVVKSFGEILRSFIAFVMAIPGHVIGAIKSSVAGIKGVLSGLPIVGDLFKGGSPEGETGNQFARSRGFANRATETTSPEFSLPQSVPQRKESFAINPASIALNGLQSINPSQAPTASIGARTAAVTNSNRTQTINQSNQTTNEFNITQMPGESGEALANRVADELQRASARAVTANDSGIEF